MPSFGAASLAKLDTCDPLLINICQMVIQDYDFTVLCGQRDEAEQEEAFRTGRSKLHFPQSRHNQNPSQAVDIAPWHSDPPHIRWKSEREFCFLAGCMFQAAIACGTKLRWGGDWDRDFDLYDHNVPFDLVHFELDV